MITKTGIKKELSKRRKEHLVAPTIVLDGTFPEQEQFVTDPSRYLAACCTRRAGKSSALALKFLITMEKHPGQQNLYLALTQESAKQIMWGVLQDMNDKYRLNLKFLESSLTISHPNGAKLRLMGADLANFTRRLKGRKFSGIAIDEAQDFGPHIQQLIDDVLTPSIADFTDGWLAVTGTPGPVPQGLFFDITQNNKFGYSNHRWSLLNNPFMPDPKAFIEDLKNRREWTDTTPTLLREWKGQWVLDASSLWINYSENLNDYAALPDKHKWNYVLGVDIGHRDADAIAVVCWSETSKDTYLVEEYVKNKQGISSLVAAIDALQKKYSAYKIVIDEGGLGKKIAEDIRQRFGCPLLPADKAHKQDNVEFLNDDLRLGKFKAHKNSRFAQDSYLVQIDWDKSTPKRIQLKKSIHSDIIDAVLYAYRDTYAFTHKDEIKGPAYGSNEWGKAEQDRMWNAALEYFEQEIQFNRKLNGDY